MHTVELFVVLLDCFRSGLRENAFRLPTLAECIAAENWLHLTLPYKAAKNVKAPAAKKKKATKTLIRKKAAAVKTTAPAQWLEELSSAGAAAGSPWIPARRATSNLPRASVCTGVGLGFDRVFTFHT